MSYQQLIDQLWSEYTAVTPSAEKIKALFAGRGDQVVNDHIALRTFNDPRVNVDTLAQRFLQLGYQEKGDYVFEAKKLLAKHFEHPDPQAPKVFISELRTELLSDFVQQTVASVLDQAGDALKDPDLLLKGRPWQLPDKVTYEKLLAESEYAAWMYIFGFRANHFTVFVNYLDSFSSLEEVNDFLKHSGYTLNSSGGEIKGSPEQLLEQSSTVADKVPVPFSDGHHAVPSCYYEFARRYEQANGQLYQGFIASSADKIFESTNVNKD